MGKDVGAQNAAQGLKRRAFFGCLQLGVDRRAGRIADRDRAVLRSGAEIGGIAEFPHRDAAGLNFRQTAGTDEKVGLQRTHRNGQKPQISRLAADQGTGDLHRDTTVFLGHPDQGTVRDTAGDFIGGDIAFRNIHDRYSATNLENRQT